MALIELQPDSTILRANTHFLGVMGCSLEEIRSKHHRLFCTHSTQADPLVRFFGHAGAMVNRNECFLRLYSKRSIDTL